MTPPAGYTPDEPNRGVPLISMAELRQIFQHASEDDLRVIGESLAKYTYDALNARIQNDVRDDRKIRFLEAGANVTSTAGGTQLKFPGESYFDRVNFLNADLAVNAISNGRQVDIRTTGATDCMFDLLVSSCYAAEVTAGRGTEGQQFTSLSGCTFKLYSTIQGAATDAATNFTGSNMAVIYICPGLYSETPTFTSTCFILGGGQGQDSATASDAGGSAGVIIAPDTDDNTVTFSTSANGSTLRNVVVRSSGTTAAGKACVRIDNPAEITCIDVVVQPGTGQDGFYVSTTDNLFVNCRAHSGTGFRFGTGAKENKVVAPWLANCTTGIRISDGHIEISDPRFDTCTAGILTDGSASKAVINGGYAVTCTTGIDLNDGTKFAIDGMYFDDCTVGVDIASAVDETVLILRTKHDLGTTNTGIQFPASGTNSYSVIDGNIFFDDGGAGTPIANAVAGWATYGTNWYNGGPLYASSVVQNAAIGMLRHSKEVANEIEWDQFYILWGATLVTVAAAQLTLTPSATNYVEVNSSGTVSANTSAFTAGQYPLAIVTTSASDPTAVTPVAPALSHGGLASGTAAAPSPHAFVGTDHSGDDDYTLRPNVLGIGVSTGDIKMYSDAGVTQVGEWDGALGHIGIGGAATTDAGIMVQPTFTAPAATRYGANISPSFNYTGASAIAHYGAYIVPNLTIDAAATQSGAHHALGSGWAVTDNSSGGTISDIAAWSPILSTAGTVIVTAARAIHVHDAVIGGGSIGTYYGIDIPVLSAATTLNVGIRNLATSRLVGAVTVGSDAAVSSGVELEVVGQQRNQGDITFDGIAAPGTPASDDIVVYNETATDLLKAKEDNGAVYALTHKHELATVVDGSTASTTAPYSGIRVPHAGVITGIYVKTLENITIGATDWIGDVHLVTAANAGTDGQGTTIYTTQANRPTISSMYQAATAPDVTTFAAGDWLMFYTDQAGTDATAISFVVEVRYT